MGKLIVFFVGLFVSLSSGAQQDAYRIAVGDTVRIQVVGEPDLSLLVILNESGVYNYPFLGEVALLGKTVAEVQALITNGLKGDYLVDPKVNVNVQPLEVEEDTAALEGIYVNGEVSRNGQINFVEGLTVGKAIVIAGGFTERAAKNKIRLLSGTGDDEVRVGLDYVLKPGDIITVPRRFF